MLSWVTALGSVVAEGGDGWFLAFRCYTKYVQVQFFRGTSLGPEPPKASKHPEVRYLDIHEDDGLDQRQLRSWIRQASKLPGVAGDVAKEASKESR